MSLIICVVSLSRLRGKTQVINDLTKRFAERGFKVAVIKHSIESFDTPMKDTWRHLESGSSEVIYVSPSELVNIRRVKADLNYALSYLQTEPDIVFVEGFKSSDKPKILCAKDLEEAKRGLKTISNVIAITGEILNKESQKKELKKIYPNIPITDVDGLFKIISTMYLSESKKLLPGLNCGRCGYRTCEELAKAVIEGKAKLSNCVVLSTSIARVKLDGRNIPLTKWPQVVIKEIVSGILRALKLKDSDLNSAKKVEITVNLREPTSE